MIQGCGEWLKRTLDPPAAVLSATSEYLEGEDLVGAWLADCCTVDRTKAFSSAELYGSFQAWMVNAGEHVPSHRQLALTLKDRGYPTKRAHAGRIIVGLTLRGQSGVAAP
jgi:phage/plasmid-associated DNA primase